jgi:FtsH-binding integral membrane protein
VIILGAFSSFSSYLFGAMPSASGMFIVLQAYTIILSIFIGIILFTLQTKYDFFSFTPHLYASLLSITITGLAHLFLPYNIWEEATLALAIALAISEYFTLMTQASMRDFSGEEYTFAVASCYVFLFLPTLGDDAMYWRLWL